MSRSLTKGEGGMIKRWAPDRRKFGDLGASLVEYALLLALIALVCISALVYFGGESKNSVGHSQACIDYYTNGNGPPPANGCG